LKIVTETNYPPITFKNKNNQPDGLAVEVTKKIMQNLKLKQKIDMLPWARAYSLAQTKPNIVLFSVSRTKQRDKLFQWAGPIYSMKSSFYAKKDSKIKINNLEDAKKLKKIGTYFECFDEQFLKQQEFKNLKSTRNNIVNIRKLLRGRLDTISATNVTIKDMLKEANASFEDIKNVYTFMSVGVYYAFSKDIPFEVVDAWRKELEKLRSSGELQKIRDKWLK
jgi:polar amino acid transport system substrate-binding protein